MKKFLFLLIFIGASCSAFATATVTQKEWRWRSDDGGETNATWIASQDQPAARGLCTIGDVIRLRMVMQVNPDPSAPSNTANRTTNRNISYATSPGGPWTPITTSSPLFVVSNSAFVTDGQPTTEQMVSSGGVFGPGVIIAGTSTAQITFSTPGSVTTRREYEWVIRSVTGVQAITYYFKFEGANTWPNSLPSITFAGGPTSSTQNISECSNYTSPSGNYNWTASGIYNDTISNSVGCDSVITTNLVIGNNTGTMSATACNSYMSPSGNYIWTTSGTYMDTIPNVTGCDSVITANITINNSSSSMITATRCALYTSPSGNYSWTTTGIYNDTIPNMSGCDSVITVDLTINNTAHSYAEITCDSILSPSGNYTWTMSGVYNDTIQNAAGCDSLLTVNLTVNTIDASVTNSNETITANNSNATYQWVDCNNNNTPITGETSQSFTATSNGNYAVIVSDANCTKMSPCTLILTTGLNTNSTSSAITLYPNPNNGSFTIETSSTVTIEITNAIGQVVLSRMINSGKNAIALENAVNGVYFVSTIDNAGNKTTQKIIIAQ
jgi:hypothetical protein